MQNDQTLAQLNTYLRTELAAIEAYQRALANVSGEPLRETLTHCEESHAQRVELLRTRISEMGGEPIDRAPPWNMAAKAEPEVLSELESFERRGLVDYQRDREVMDLDSQQFVQTALLPSAQAAHAQLQGLMRRVL